MFFCTQGCTYEYNNQFIVYFIPNTQTYSIFQNDCPSNPTTPFLPHVFASTPTLTHPSSLKQVEPMQTMASLGKQRSGRIEARSRVEKTQGWAASKKRRASRVEEKRRSEQTGLDFRTEWKNQNRNIVPNLVNQMMSFLLKRSKSEQLIDKLFCTLPHPEEWTSNKFYLYMRKIKDSACHYLDQTTLRYFFQVHEPECEIYSAEEQEFYMKVCRISIISFLRNDAIIVTLTSLRMGEAKRKNHLIAREALLRRFLELGRSQHL